MSMSISNDTTAHVAYKNTVASTPSKSNKSADIDGNAAAKSADSVTLSKEAREGASPPLSKLSAFSPVKMFDLPNGTSAILSTAKDEQGNTVAQLSYVDSNGVYQDILLDETSTLRFAENGDISVIPYDKSANKEIVMGKIQSFDGESFDIKCNARSVQGSDADEVIIILPSNVKSTVWNIDAGNGNNLVFDLSQQQVVIKTGNGNDTILGIGGLYRIESGAGDDVVDLTDPSMMSIDAGAGNDRITATATGGMIPGHVSGGDGDDVIEIKGHMYGDIVGGAGSDNIKVQGNVLFSNVYGDTPEQGGAGNDTIQIDGTLIKGEIHTGSGNNSVVVGHAVRSQIYGGDGEDSIVVGNAFQSSIDGGDGEDYIVVGDAFQSSIDGGNGNDTLAVVNLFGSELLGGNGNNTIRVLNAYGSEIYSSDKASAKTKETSSRQSEKRELSEFEQAIADAAMGLTPDTEDKADDIPESTENATGPSQEAQQLEAVPQDARPRSRAANKYSNQYTFGAYAQEGVSVSVSI